jgi:hypothetical protein
MSEDRLENALEAMRQESVDEATLDAARARVLTQLASGLDSNCAEFRPDFPAYLSGALVESRRVLMDDHLSRCPACRSAMADLRGERRVIPMPQRAASSRWQRWGAVAAAAVVVVAVGYGARDTLDAMLAPGGPRATVVMAEGGLYRMAGDALTAGATLGDGEVVRTGPGAHALLRLIDGSIVDVNQRTELFATAAWSGQTIHLQRGDVVVRAAKQRRGHLRVLTRDSIASVKGTVFAVSTGLGGSVVSVVEGSVAVNQPGKDVLLKPGQQAASNPALTSSVADAIAWSPSADEYLEILGSFVKIERQLAESFPSQQRTASALLAYLPSGAFVYGAVPNLNGQIGPALALAEQQSSENAAFRAWWNSETGQSLRQLIDQLQSVSSLLGDEVVFSATTAASGQDVPMVIARVQPGKRADLARALDALFADASGASPGTTGAALPYSVTDDLMVVSGTPTQLAAALAGLGQGATSPFATAIADRYRRGTGWLLAIDAPGVVAKATRDGDDAPPVELAAMLGMKYAFIEQRAPAGTEENEVTLTFDGAKKGMASWLADAGAGGVAEYVPADALVAGYVSMREPWQLFQDFTTLMVERNASFESSLAKVDETLGSGFIANLTSALGNEAAFSLNGFTVSGPRWSMAALVYNPTVLDSSLRTFMDAFNAQLPPDAQSNRLTFEQETANGRMWNTMKAGLLPLSVTWTYDAGYLVAASDRATAERAIATRNGGSPLVWSSEFLSQLPTSAGMHPSGFAWLNTKGALSMFSTLATSATVTKLLAERDPVLFVVDGTPDQIHAASRTRLPGLILNMMLLENLGNAGQQAAVPTAP